ncbi:hypothetical protein DICVIV_13392 [Dictyocaulus viviparus]|uniref:Uncharacterized protein n=1 Tax=Dictyocaulus viviparus TaxID=29172 RepID=A0A0D8X7V9_DICVI|nr:hypothetical protein DICVIV_13392 [Dictyocaulus viviparus]
MSAPLLDLGFAAVSTIKSTPSAGCESASGFWQTIVMESTKSETKPVWVYVIFRKNRCSGHEKMTVNISSDGPVFWNRQVAYIYCCSCHFDEHEEPLMAILSKFEQRVERMCIVDRPVDYPFLPDSIFSYMAKCMPKLQFIYLRELDLEKINRATVADLANHNTLKKAMLGDFDEEQSGSSSQSLSQFISQPIPNANDQAETITVEVSTGP